MIKKAFTQAIFICGFLSCVVNAQTSTTAHWIDGWSAPASELQDRIKTPTTFRNVVHISLGGKAIRIQISNELGTVPLTIGEVQVAFAGTAQGTLDAPSLHPVLFGGKANAIIAAHAYLTSDSIPMPIAALSDLAISIYVPEAPATGATCHAFAGSTNFTTDGNTASASSLKDAKRTGSWCYLKAVEVDASANATALVAFGDSITDGDQSMLNMNHRWPDVLAMRLRKDPRLAQVSVLNSGIGGNRILHDNAGPSALARFDRDVLTPNGVKTVVILEGVNDLGHSEPDRNPYEPITADDLIAGMRELASRAHNRGIRVLGATILPYDGAGYHSAAGEAARQKINDWIRTTREIDGVVDFDKAVRDPQRPTWLLPAYDSGDHLHPGNAGYKAMGEAVDLSLIQ